MSEPDRFDIIIVGAGSGGVSLASTLVAHDWRVALIADRFVGGECPYVACMPSKSLLRSARARTEARSLVRHGAAERPAELDDDETAWAAAIRRRDETANHRDDQEEAQSLQDKGIEVIRGFGVLAGEGRVTVGSRELTAPEIVLDTGSVPVLPEIDGLADVPAWTSDQALTETDRPDRLIILGGGPIGCELGQVYATFGVEVTIVDTADRLVPAEDPVFGRLMAQVMTGSDVRLALGVTPQRAERNGAGVRLVLADGSELAADRVLVVTGRRPATEGLGLERTDVRVDDAGAVQVDGQCRAANGVWAIGDVTALAPYTHTANHQARVVADTLLNRRRHSVTPDALPRAVFTEPPLAGTGLTEKQAVERGFAVAVAEVSLDEVSRAGAEGQGLLGAEDAAGGLLRLVADRETGRLLGATAIGPNADSWIVEATLAITTGASVEMLADVVRPFPTYAEAFTLGYDTLLSQLQAAEPTSA